MQKSKFSLGTQEIPMFLGHRLAHGKMEEMGLSIYTIMEPENTVLQSILINDSLMLKIMFFYVDEHCGMSWDEFLESLDSHPGALEKFRNAFWEMVVGFSAPAVQEPLRDLWRQAKKMLKDSVNQTLNTSSSQQQVDSN